MQTLGVGFAHRFPGASLQTSGFSLGAVLLFVPQRLAPHQPAASSGITGGIRELEILELTGMCPASQQCKNAELWPF